MAGDVADALHARAQTGDHDALAELFAQFRPRLRSMLQLRMDPRLRRRVDPSDVLQETFLEASNRLDRYIEEPRMPLFIWVRFLASQKLLEAHRRHLGAQRRDARREVRLHAGPEASSLSIAQHLMGDFTSPTQGVRRLEIRQKLERTLETMDPIDREVLTLRHFEELSNNEVAAVLELTKAGASRRYLRALKRLRAVLAGDLGPLGGSA